MCFCDIEWYFAMKFDLFFFYILCRNDVSFVISVKPKYKIHMNAIVQCKIKTYIDIFIHNIYNQYKVIIGNLHKINYIEQIILKTTDIVY